MSDCDIFVSYAHEDRERIQPFVHALEGQGWSVFWDRTLPPGESWRSYIGTRLNSAPVVIVAWSKHSIESDWVAQEAERAIARRALIPVMIDEVVPPLGLSHIHAADLVGWLDDGTKPLPPPLQRAIAARLGKPAVAIPPSVAPSQSAPAIRPAAAEGAPAAPPPPAASAPAAAGLSRLARTGIPLPVFALLALAVAGWVVYDRLVVPGAPPPPKACVFAGDKVVHGASVTAYLNATSPHGRPCASEQRVCHNGALSGTFDHKGCTVAAAPKDCTFDGATIVHGATVNAYLNPKPGYDRPCTVEQRVCRDGALSGSFDHKSCTPAAPPRNCAFDGKTVEHGRSVQAYQMAATQPGGSCAAEWRQCQDGALSGSYAYSSCTVAAPQPNIERGVQAAVRWGLIGNWASGVCGTRATASQPIIRFAIQGYALVREVDSGAGVERTGLSEIRIRPDDGYLEYIMEAGVRVVVVAKGVDGRIRVHSSRGIGGGYTSVQVENGKIVANGQDSPWLVRCY
jgi:hypothetical protein